MYFARDLFISLMHKDCSGLLAVQYYLKCRYFVLYRVFYSFNFSVDPFTRKDWYDVKAPAMFSVRNTGKTLVNRTQGTSKF